MAATNTGSGITRFNTGPNADVTSSGLGSHTMVAPTATTNGNFTTTSNNQVISARQVNGVIIIKHTGVEIWNCTAYGCWIDTDKMGTKMYWTTFGITNGAVEDTWGTTCIKGGDYLMVRCQVFGWVDHTRPNWGDTRCVEVWFGPPYIDPTGHSDGGPAHCDPSQPHPPPGSVPVRSIIYQACAFIIFPFNNRTAGYLSKINVYDENLKATCGTINNEFYKCPNGTMRDCYFKGNASQILMLQNGDNNTTNGTAWDKNGGGTPLPPMENWNVFDNIWDFTGQPSFGTSRAFCNFGNYPKHVAPTIGWARNRDINGNTLVAFYRQPGTSPWKTRDPGPATNYWSFYGTNPPDNPDDPPPPPVDPVIKLVIDQPAVPGQTYTSGSLVFHGQPDVSAGDSVDKYTYINYHVVFPDEVQSNGNIGSGRIQLDHDAAGNNTGFTFNTISADGVTFTRRGGTAPETHKGRAQLIVVGERIGSSTWPEAQIEVTFGDVTPPPPPTPPTNVAFEVPITFDVRAVPKLKTSVGGIPKAQITLIPRRIPTGWITVWVPVWDKTKGGTDEEVVPIDANTYKRRYE